MTDMHKEPHISRDQLYRHLKSHYALAVSAIDFLPVGEGAWCYRATGDRRWFVRIGKWPVPEAALALMTELHEVDFPMIPLLPNNDGSLVSRIGELQLTVQPWFECESLMERSGSRGQFHVRVGELTARLHAFETTTDLALEDYRRYQQETRAIMDATVSGRFLTVREAARPGIECVLEAAVALGERLRAVNARRVPCHGDLHDDNVLVGEAGQIRIIDWDGVMLAPPERDLFYFLGTGWNDTMRGYDPAGTLDVNPALLDYYVLEWALQEIVDYGGRIVFDARFDAAAKADALERFGALFRPGGDVDRALALVSRGLH